MDKDSYNIDSILSEVKKRREENETAIKAKAREPKLETLGAIKSEPAEKSSFDEEPADIVEKIQNSIQKAQEKEDEPKPVIPEPKEEETENFSFEEDADEQSIETENEPETESEEEGMINILSLTDEDEEEPEIQSSDGGGSKQKKKKKTLRIILSILLILVVGAGGFAIWYANDALNQIVEPDQDDGVSESEWKGMEGDEKNFDAIDETEATQLASLNDMLKTWYYNGTPCSSSKVLNVLLIGEDTRGDNILESGTRADSAIIVSINAETKEITLTSILRDAWAYWETKPGDESTGKFGKINGAMSTGDINAYISCLENLMKINIDNYVIVNFDSFESIVDAMGGVTLTITSAEINEINSHQKRYNHTTITKQFEGNKGKQKLTGKQALAYCRIRKLDSDNKRADRQKKCLIQIFKQAKKSSNTKLLRMINKLLPYVKTGFGKSQIIQIAKYAFTEGWLDFDTVMQNMPEYNIKGGKAYGGQWIWKCDFPADAYNLQMRIYRESNITLAHIRVDTKNCPETGFYSEGAGAMSTTVTNEHYGEVTTQPTTTKKSKTSATTSN